MVTLKWKSLKTIHRLEYIPGHEWTTISLQLNGAIHWNSEASDKVIENFVNRIEKNGEWEVIGINISENKSKVHLLAKDIRKRSINFSVKGISKNALNEQDIINLLTKAGCYDIIITDYESQIMNHEIPPNDS